MRCFVVVSGAVTLMVMSTHKSATHPDLAKRLKANDIKQMMLMEVSVDLARERYGEHFEDLSRKMGKDEFRVLDFNGGSVFRRFSFREMGEPIKVEF